MDAPALLPAPVSGPATGAEVRRWTAALAAEVEAQAGRWFLWAPVAFGGGAATYFTLKSEPPGWVAALPLLALAAALVAARWNRRGPLLDASGRLVGVVSGGLKDEAVGEGHAQNVNYAVAPFVVQAFLQEHDVAFTHGRATRETAETIAAKARGHTVHLECWS